MAAFNDERCDPRENETGFGIMGLLNFFSKPPATLLRLPSGTFTVDRQGAVLIGTLPSSFPGELTHAIGQRVLEAFRQAEQAQLPLSELIVSYPSLKITARELRGGAIIFLSPRTPFATSGPS
jgi:hypothetical protein